MAKVRIAGLVLLTGLVLVLAGCKSGGDTAAAPETVPIQNRLHGNDAALKHDGVLLINSAAELAATGSHDLARQNIDFGKQSVLLVSLGKRTTAGYWVRIVAVERSGSDVYVQAVANAPVAGTPAAAAAPGSPYDAVIVAKIKSASVHPEVKSVTGQSDTLDAAESAFIAHPGAAPAK